MIQSLFDGVLVGAILSLGAIDLTLVMHILRFANFSHAELLSIGAFAALVFDAALAAAVPAAADAIGSLSLTAALLIAVLAAMVVTGLSALAIDRLVFRRLRATVGPLSLVFASFGVALIVRNGIALAFGLGPRLYTATRSRSRWCCSTIRSCWRSPISSSCSRSRWSSWSSCTSCSRARRSGSRCRQCRRTRSSPR